MENGGLKTTISEDSPMSEAPLESLDVEVLPRREKSDQQQVQG